MTKEELRTVAELFPIIDKKRLIDNLSQGDFLTLCECFQELLDEQKALTESARNQLDLLLGTKKVSKEFKKIFDDLV